MRAPGESSPKRQRIAVALETAEALHIESAFSGPQICAFVEQFVSGHLTTSADAVPVGTRPGTAAEFGEAVARLALAGKLPCEPWALQTVRDSIRPPSQSHATAVARWCGRRAVARPAFVAARRVSIDVVMREGPPVVGAGL